MTFEIDKDHELLPFSEVCSRCAHNFPRPASEFTSADPTGRCKAFPNGIPFDIWTGKNKHDSPYPGDNGITFTPVDISKKD